MRRRPLPMWPVRSRPTLFLRALAHLSLWAHASLRSHPSLCARVRGRARESLRLLLPLILVAPVTASLGQSPPDLSADVPWDEDPATSGAQASHTGVAAIEAAFDNARREEERQFQLPPGTLGHLELPPAADWAAMRLAGKALLIVNAERVARGGVAYPGGEPLALPLQAIEHHLDQLAKDYAEYMRTNNFWDHAAPADGSPPFAGTDPFQRIERQPVIGAGVGSAGGDCHQFLGQAENLAAFGASAGQTISMALERALYGFLYEDAGSDWGHRHLLLLQDRPLSGDGGFTNDFGPPDSEGFLGVGTAGANDGSYAIFDDTATFPVQRNIVLLIIDPVPDPACGYDIRLP